MTMNRRDFQLRLAATLAATLPPAAAIHAKNSGDASPWATLEKASGGRLGVAVLRADGRLDGHRLDERFAMCSVFKWLAAAHVLQRVDAGQERLDRRVVYGKEVLLRHSPITEKHVGAPGMTMAELCHAAVTVSDNGAGNLLLDSFGGPDGITRFARSLGDEVTRLDRWELDLNEAKPGDPRDTSSPRAMAKLLQSTVLGTALSPSSREQLKQWLLATESNRARLGASVPTGWQVGSKTGTGSRGTTNDAGIYWPVGREPIIVVAFLTDTKASETVRNATIANVGRQVSSPS